ncbi:DUF4783 domain-containing protein [Bacteroides ihuae]|uniref:DUF4783 domain-containing protein n=1 Tax=Bacteroides ihuae TaxID=1852362 RepID=UPI0008D9176E|nr:DUF4783 domain-containing protein [Bacteroides ihuae]
MKKTVFLWISSMFLLMFTLSAQEVPTGIDVAFKKGSAQELAKYMADKVDLIVLNKASNFGKSQAENAMTTFFAENKVNGFTVNHQGKRDESSFIVGTLTTSNGSFRVNCFLKRLENKYLIHQIRIDKTNE